MEYIWTERGFGYSEREFQKFFAKTNGYLSEPLARMLMERTGGNVDNARAFLRPKWSMLHDPYLYKDMDKAINRLCKALDSGERIMVYGDYDVDGTTSVALVYSFLLDVFFNGKPTDKLTYYVPDRYEEGYGVSEKGVLSAAARKCTLIIALDCGIKDNPRVDLAAQKGIDFIVCDHHTPGDQLPNAFAVLDAKRTDNTYPFDELSGCGVGFKLLQALCKRRRISEKRLLEYLDLVAVSIVSDIVSMTGENRVLAYYGLKKINSCPMTSIAAIIANAKINNKTITVEDMLFAIGPRINAAGRMKSGMEAVKLLISKDLSEATKLAGGIAIQNNERKEADHVITENALKQLKADPANAKKCSTVVCGTGWHKGVVGIVASRLTETYYRPTIVLSRNGDMLTGSARSVSDFNLYDAIDSCRKYLTAFGGHKFAAGLSMKAEDYEKFRTDFEKYVKKHIQPHQKRPAIIIERYIGFDEITNDFYKKLQEFQPFGPDNCEPVFATRGVVNCGRSCAVGKEQPQKHLRLEVMDSTGKVMVGIGFGLAAYASVLQSGAKVDICYTVTQNVFNGRASLQLMVKDIKVG